MKRFLSVLVASMFIASAAYAQTGKSEDKKTDGKTQSKAVKTDGKAQSEAVKTDGKIQSDSVKAEGKAKGKSKAEAKGATK